VSTILAAAVALAGLNKEDGGRVARGQGAAPAAGEHYAFML